MSVDNITFVGSAVEYEKKTLGFGVAAAVADMLTLKHFARDPPVAAA
jgi:hypothetical protein